MLVSPDARLCFWLAYDYLCNAGDHQSVQDFLHKREKEKFEKEEAEKQKEEARKKRAKSWQKRRNY
jgi:hypothetical protein